MEGYGLTEAGPNNFLANGKAGTLGHPMPCVDVKIVDTDGNKSLLHKDAEYSCWMPIPVRPRKRPPRR
mgnify:CR=1 FL=1